MGAHLNEQTRLSRNVNKFYEKRIFKTENNSVSFCKPKARDDMTRPTGRVKSEKTSMFTGLGTG